MPALTPFFPSWKVQLAPMGARVAQTVKTVRAYTLCHLEERFGACLPQTLFPKAARPHQQPRSPLHPLADLLVHALAGV
jgi:hypothetical protein